MGGRRCTPPASSSCGSSPPLLCIVRRSTGGCGTGCSVLAAYSTTTTTAQQRHARGGGWWRVPRGLDCHTPTTVTLPYYRHTALLDWLLLGAAACSWCWWGWGARRPGGRGWFFALLPSSVPCYLLTAVLLCCCGVAYHAASHYP